MLAVTWWGLIFGLMIEAGVLTVREAGWCMGDTSGLCRALATLCTADHPLGLKTYSPELFWASLCLLAAGAFGRLLALFFTPTLASLPTLRFRSWR
ncbi:hypothetical protein [Blastochloris viridis]|uniref:Uncharacterized protein n=1 Tax=Blastochloris viridis TaxID=1079 RepID=A0A182D777_BLAVI|nr:hypothetical protein [Blastochloris viridis]BAS00753.1 hypothetical protein BV133_3159 [Blastochloris viridis]